MQKRTCGLLAGLGLAIVTAALVGAGEEKIPLDKLPKPVVNAVKKKFPKAEWAGAVKSTADGPTTYEVTLKAGGGLGIDVTVNADGNITQIERELAVKDLPTPVGDAFAAKYPKVSVKRIEELVKVDKIISYEMLIETAAKKTLEVYFDPAGKFLEEKDRTPK
jgi:hypothetical protein